MFLNAEPQTTRARTSLVQRALADARLQRRHVGLVAFEIGFHRVIVLVDDQFDQLHAVLGGFVGEVGGDLFVEEFGAQRFVLPDDRAVLDQIDQTLEVGLEADRDVKHGGLGSRGGQ